MDEVPRRACAEEFETSFVRAHAASATAFTYLANIIANSMTLARIEGETCRR
jgi:hypothetical protein